MIPVEKRGKVFSGIWADANRAIGCFPTPQLCFILFDVQGFECLPQWPAMVRQILFLDSTVYQTFPRKSPWKLSTTRKANARERLKKVDAVIEAVRVSGVQCKALVRHISFCFRWVSR